MNQVKLIGRFGDDSKASWNSLGNLSSLAMSIIASINRQAEMTRNDFSSTSRKKLCKRKILNCNHFMEMSFLNFFCELSGSSSPCTWIQQLVINCNFTSYWSERKTLDDRFYERKYFHTKERKASLRLNGVLGMSSWYSSTAAESRSFQSHWRGPRHMNKWNANEFCVLFSCAQKEKPQWAIHQYQFSEKA